MHKYPLNKSKLSKPSLPKLWVKNLQSISISYSSSNQPSKGQINMNKPKPTFVQSWQQGSTNN